MFATFTSVLVDSDLHLSHDPHYIPEIIYRQVRFRLTRLCTYSNIPDMDKRQEKALMIAAKSRITKKGDLWLVPSQSGSGNYKVDANPEAPSCTCPDFELRKLRCKHIYATEMVIEREQSITQTTQTANGETTVTTVTEKVKVTYKQEWTAYNTAQTQEKDLFQKLLAELCGLVTNPEYTKGRPRLSYGEMIFAAAFKVYSTVSCRRFQSDLRDAQGKGYLTKVPHFNSIFNYLEQEALTPVLKELITQSALPLKSLESDFAVDSSGFSTCQHVRWFDAKYGKEIDHHDWVKVHLMSGVHTHVVTAVEIKDRNSNDGTFLPGLVEDTAKNFSINEVSGDKAYATVLNHETIAKVGATPYIAFKANATGAAGGLFGKMFHYFSFNREDFLTHYHKRSNVETTMHMVKAKFGSRIRSKGAVAQTNEVLCKILCHNICCVIQAMFEFGLVPTFCAEIAVAQKAS